MRIETKGSLWIAEGRGVDGSAIVVIMQLQTAEAGFGAGGVEDQPERLPGDGYVEHEKDRRDVGQERPEPLAPAAQNLEGQTGQPSQRNGGSGQRVEPTLPARPAEDGGARRAEAAVPPEVCAQGRGTGLMEVQELGPRLDVQALPSGAQHPKQDRLCIQQTREPVPVLQEDLALEAAVVCGERWRLAARRGREPWRVAQQVNGVTEPDAGVGVVHLAADRRPWTFMRPRQRLRPAGEGDAVLFQECHHRSARLTDSFGARRAEVGPV